MKDLQAFPCQTWEYDGQSNVLQYQEEGMTLRDYFAARAMEAMITKGMEDNKRGAAGVPFIVEYAYEYADAMIKQRNKKGV